jgi:hypothetical protein
MVDGTSQGFTWGPMEVVPAAGFHRRDGIYRVVTITTTAGRQLDIYVSPTGRSVRVFRKGKEMK